MMTRTRLRVGGLITIVAAAALAACGGGGGGTPTPVTPPGTPTPTIAPTTQATTAALSPSATTPINFGGISENGVNILNSASMTMPAVSVATTAQITLEAPVPSGVATPSAMSVHLKKPSTLGVPTTPIAYFAVTVNPTVTITQSPAFTINFTTAQTGNCYIIVFDTSNPTQGWNGLLGPQPCSSSVSFPAVPINPPYTLNSSSEYIFAIVATSGTIETPTPSPSPSSSPGAAATLPPVTGSTFGGYAPWDVATAFNFPVQSGYNGAGETVAIIGDETPSPGDLQGYQNDWSLPGNPAGNVTVKNVSGVTPGGSDPSGLGEATLDVETVMGLAPGANIVFYNTQGDLSNSAFLLAEQQVKTDNPNVFSLSFGGCESYPVSQATPAPDSPVFAAMNANGMAVTASSGDQGDNCFTGQTSPQFTFGVNYPASDPSVIGVGGNETIPTTSSLTAPVAWNDTAFSGSQGATGGGVSVAYAIPSFQAGVSGMFSTTQRNVPDVAMPAEGVLIQLNGKMQEFGGTSWAAPQTAALMAELDEYCNGRPTNAVAELYKAYSQSAGKDFIAITSGNNAYGAESVTYKANANGGYNNTTGLGLLKGMSIAQTMCPSGTWTGGVGGATRPMALASNYGAARPTQLPYVRRFTDSQDRGPVAAGTQTNVLLVLRNTPTAGSDQQKIIDDLTAHGFTVKQTFADHSMIQVSAPASAIASYFNTEIHQVDGGKYGMLYSNASPIVLPASIAPYVSTVFADNLPARIPLSYRIR